ncbi:MAG: hypothetical protein U1E83_07275 [Methylotetracoccus sp.]
MIASLESLGLQPDRVHALRDACDGIGRGYLKSIESYQDTAVRQLALIAAGTNLRRAAAHSLLLNESDRGRLLFRVAAEAYIKAENPYGAFLETLAQGGYSDNSRKFLEPRRAADVWLLWSPYVVSLGVGTGKHPSVLSERIVDFRNAMDAFRTEPVGLLGITVATHLELFDAVVMAITAQRRDTLSEAILSLLAPYTAAVKRCRADRYHWTRLALPFHPVEPDVIGILLALSAWLQSTHLSLSDLIMNLALGSDTMTLLRGALEQYGAWEPPLLRM